MTHADYCRQFIPEGGVVLDVGSGKGKLAVELARQGYEVHGIEINPDYIRQSQLAAAERGVQPVFVLGTAEQLPYPDNHFEFANCAEVTEHVDDPARVCREIFRILRPGGHAYVSFHNRFGMYDYHYHLWGINWLPRQWATAFLRWARREKQDMAAGRQRLSTMHYYTFGAVARLLRGCGFEVFDARENKIRKRFGVLSFPLLAAYRLLLRPLYFNTFHLLIRKP